MRKIPGSAGYDTAFTTCIGIVKNNADPAQHGRLQIYIPSIDSPDYDLEDLSWAIYVSPFGGVTADFKVSANFSIPELSCYPLEVVSFGTASSLQQQHFYPLNIRTSISLVSLIVSIQLATPCDTRSSSSLA